MAPAAGPCDTVANVSGKQRAPSSESRADKGRPEEPASSEGLLEQRETFIQTFFKKGAELTEELLHEDQRLRKRLSEVEAENAALRAQVASEDAIRDLLAKIQHLEKEKRELLSRMSDAQASSSHYSSRFAEIEAENAQLASLYVASHQLHSTLELRSIVRQLKELLAQFLGARAFAVYLLDDDKKELVPICSEGVNTSALKRLQVETAGVIGRAVESGAAEWVEGDATRGTIDAPSATIPMLLNGKAVGAIAVFATYEQKREFIDVDFELFKLLGAHAASALVASRLFAEHGAKVGRVENFLDLE
jgi:hypothetical protein